VCKHQLLLPMRNLESCSAYLRAFPKWKQSTHRWSSRSLRNLIFTHSQGTSALHSLRQQLADAANARDVARVHEQAADARAATMESLRAASEAAAAEASSVAAHEIASLRCSLDLAQQNDAELQRLLQQKRLRFFGGYAISGSAGCEFFRNYVRAAAIIQVHAKC
jgi:hypothetical protein